jgi:hypothetical protein
MRLGDDDDSGLDRTRDGAGITRPAGLGARERSLAAYSRTSFEIQECLRSLAPFVTMVKAAHSRQRHELRRG